MRVAPFFWRLPLVGPARQFSTDAAYMSHLHTQVTSIHAAQKPFTIRIKSEDFERVQAKLHSTVRNAKQSVIVQSVTDRFLQVSRNVLFVPEYAPVAREPRVAWRSGAGGCVHLFQAPFSSRLNAYMCACKLCCCRAVYLSMTAPSRVCAPTPCADCHPPARFFAGPAGVLADCAREHARLPQRREPGPTPPEGAGIAVCVVAALLPRSPTCLSCRAHRSCLGPDICQCC